MRTTPLTRSEPGGAGIEERAPRLRLLTGAVLSLHAAFVYRFWWLNDDAFISFRYARNLARGEGIRFNVWDQTPVEGYSNFLWVLTGGALHTTGLNMVLGLQVLSSLCGAALLALLLHRLVRVLEVPAAIAGVTVAGLACYPPFAAWSTGGLATMPLALLVFLTFDRLVLAARGPDALLGGVFGSLLILLRVEGIAWFTVLLVLALISQVVRRRYALRPLLGAALIGAAVFAGHLFWRHGYYGHWLPNTYYAKQVSGWSFVERGANYLLANVLTFLVPLVIIPGLVAAWRRRRGAVGVGVAALAWAFPIYAIVVSGDYMPMGRFLIPGLAFGTILWAWLLTDLGRGSPKRMRLALLAGVGVGVIGALPGWDVHVVPLEIRSEFGYRRHGGREMKSEYQRWAELSSKVMAWGRLGRMLRAYAGSELERPVSMVVRALGTIGYDTDFLMYDCAGLTVPEIARRQVTEWKSQPGHDKSVEPEYFVDFDPSILRAWSLPAGEPEAIIKQINTILKGIAGGGARRASRMRYRPDLVRMVETNGGRTKYLLALVRTRRASVMAWRDKMQMVPTDLDKVREITY